MELLGGNKKLRLPSQVHLPAPGGNEAGAAAGCIPL